MISKLHTRALRDQDLLLSLIYLYLNYNMKWIIDAKENNYA